jgi:hypothetical protein
MSKKCNACGCESDDLYEINGWSICSACARTRRFWEMLRESFAASAAVPS